MVDERSVAVVGAGAAGLAAAWRLARAGERVTLYEAGARAGGLLRTERMSGAQVDVGVQLVSSTHTALAEWVRDMGAAGLLRESAGRDALWRRGRAHGITYGSVTSMASSGALPTTLKLRLAAKYLPYLRTRLRGLDANDPAATGGAALDTESIGDWGRRELGDDFVELLAYPLLAAYYGATPEETSAPVYHSLALVGMDVSLYAAADGFGTLADVAVTSLEREGGRFMPLSPVHRVHADASGVEVETAAGAVRHDGVVLALPANRALAVLGLRGATGGGVSPGAAPGAGAGAGAGAARLGEWLARVQERSTFSVAYRLDRDFPGDYFGLSFPRAAGQASRVAALCVQGRKLRGLVPEGGEAIVALPSPRAVAELGDSADDDVATALLAALDGSVPGVARRVTEVRVTRFEDGYTVFHPGYLRALAAFRAEWLPPRVTLAGDYLVAPSVEGAVRSGRRGARLLLDRLDAAG